MATEKQLKAAEAVYNTVINHLDQADFKYEIIPEAPQDSYMIKLSARGDDLPMEFFIVVDADSGVVCVKSPQMCSFAGDKLDLGAKALCAINDTISDGRYSLNLDTGTVMFTISSTFRGSLLGDDAIHYLLGMSFAIVDNFNEKLLMLHMGVMDLDTFRSAI